MATAAAGAAACTITPEELTRMTAQEPSLPEFNWQMATSFPPVADIILGSAHAFADSVAAMTGGKFRIEPRMAGELAPPLELMNVVEQGAVQCSLTASYYYIGKSPVTAFGTSLPFGLTARQNNAWFYHGGELFQALQSGAIDAAEWIGPYDDLRMKFHQVAKYYYYPAWWEPGPNAEFQFNLEAWNELPEEYRLAVDLAARATNLDAVAQYDAKNFAALQELKTHDIQILPFPDDFMQAAETEAFAIFEEIAARDPDFNAIFRNWSDFREGIREWHGLAEAAMINYQSAL